MPVYTLRVGARFEAAHHLTSYKGVPEPAHGHSWRVEAVRNDAWVKRHGAPVEVVKEGAEAGTYQHPELYGQPASKGTHYDGERAQRTQQPAAE